VIFDHLREVVIVISFDHSFLITFAKI
jgi:hypothetical protein